MMSRTDARRVWWYASTIIYIVFFAACARWYYYNPALNWDVIGYIGSVKSLTSSDPDVVYNETMDELRQSIPEERFEQLNTYNRLSNNVKAFTQQLPFYKVKPLYNVSVLALNRLTGMPEVEATYVLSIFGFLLLGALCWYFRPGGVDPGLWWMIVIGFASFGAGAVYKIASLSTPDTLCFALSVGGFCFWVYGRSALMFGVCMLLSQLMRSDTLLLTLFLLAFFTFDDSQPQRLPLKAAVIIGWLAVVMYLAINYWAGDYGWRVLFHYKFIKKTSFPADQVPGFGFPRYFAMVHFGVNQLLYSKRVQLLLLFTVVSSIYHWFMPMGKTFFFRALWLVWLAYWTRIALFPAYAETRYYYGFYYMIIYCISELLAPYVPIAARKMGWIK